MAYFVMPTDTNRVTSDYGWRIIQGKRNWHPAIDLAEKGYHPIFAVADGKVIDDFKDASYGIHLVIEHVIKGRVFHTLYAHLEEATVRVGDKVKQGQVIGVMGNTGHSFGQHLHFELHDGPWVPGRKNAVNPLPYLFKGFWSGGDRGPDVEDLQDKLQALGYYKGKIDGIFGPLTDAAVKVFQKAQKIRVDGKVGPVTSQKLEDAHKPYPGHQYYYREGNVMKGEDVKAIQSKVGTKVDGLFGPLTRAAVIKYQKAHGLKVDGYVGPQTWSRMFN